MTALLTKIMASNCEKNSVLIRWTQPGNDASLIDWVRASPPAGKQIHVFLPSRHRQGGRELKHTLQRLGCTVTLTCAVRAV